MADKEFKPFVPAETEMAELTVKAVLLGAIMAVILGAANAYLRRGDAYVFNGQYGLAVGTYRLMWDYMPVHPHLIELRKVLDGEYLTPATLSASNKQWQQAQAR